MKITKEQLKRLIKEELEVGLKEEKSWLQRLFGPTGGEPGAGVTQGCKPFPKQTELKFGEASLMWCPKACGGGQGWCPGGKCGEDPKDCNRLVVNLGVPNRCKVTCNSAGKAFSRVANGKCRCKKKRA